MNQQENLSQFVRRILKEKGLSLSDVEQRAQGAISDSYICSITNGSVGSLTVTKLKALAKGLGVTEDEIFAVARGRSVESDPAFEGSTFASLFTKYRRLSIEDKREVLALIKMLDREIERRQNRLVDDDDRTMKVA